MLDHMKSNKIAADGCNQWMTITSIRILFRIYSLRKMWFGLGPEMYSHMGKIGSWQMRA